MTDADVVVYGATPGGITTAIRAARDGLRVVLLERSGHLGGFLTSGLGVMDTMYDGCRAGLYDEFCARVLRHYASEYGLGSAPYRDAAPGEEWPLRVEPGVAARLLRAWLDEEGVGVRTAHPLHAVERSGTRILALLVDGSPDSAEHGPVRITAGTFVDATYEADLAAAAGAPYRVGREDREEYGEPHAGRIFTRQALSADGMGAWPEAASSGDLDLRTFKSVSQQIYAGSTGEGDARVQAYSFRVTLCNDPDNRRIPGPPAGYDAEVYRAVDTGRPIGPPNLPHGKRFWFRNLPGGSERYPEATEAEREVIRARHRDYALGYLYFLQNDESVPEPVRAEARGYGLALDEYPDNDNFPYELYVREARRIVGDHVFTELDASIARGIRRTPVHADSIGFAEWFLDSHEVSTEVQPGSAAEGKILLTELTRPSQIPFRILFAKGIDNLVVPVCMSATHVGWGTLRLEPVWMHTGEVAGRIAALAHRGGVPARRIDVDALQRSLLADRVALAFFNDVDISDPAPATAAVQYFATRGFFSSYDARSQHPLTEAVARIWARAWAEPGRGDEGAMATARAVEVAEAAASPAIDGDGSAALLDAAAALAGRQPLTSRPSPGTLSRGEACLMLFASPSQPHP